MHCPNIFDRCCIRATLTSKNNIYVDETQKNKKNVENEKEKSEYTIKDIFI